MILVVVARQDRCVCVCVFACMRVCVCVCVFVCGMCVYTGVNVYCRVGWASREE